MSSCHTDKTSDAGWNLLELMVAMSIVAVGLLVMLQQLTISFREAEMNETRAFAFQKAAALLQEIQHAVDRGELEDHEALLELVDTADNFVLTTRTDETGSTLAPDHPMSGNMSDLGQWQWSRRVSATPHDQPGLYYVRTSVYRRDDNGVLRPKGDQQQLISITPKASPPLKVYDVYLLAIGQTPSLWRDTATLRSKMESARLALESASTVRFRFHWISNLGYGRDPLYAPYVNTSTTATAAAPWVYWYPGALGGSYAGTTLYHDDLIDARIRTDSGIANDYDATTNPTPYAVSDQFNHCARLPQARQIFDARVAAGLEKPDEPPLQILLADLYESPERFRNAIFVNLHGAGVPLPPMRNYSDPAKDPVGHPGVRVVTHPALLRAARDPNGDGNHSDTEDVELRVYAYKTDPDSGPTVMTDPILLQILDVDLTAEINGSSDSTLWIRRLIGGVDDDTGLASGGDREYESFDDGDGEAPTSPEDPYEMYYQAGYVAGAQPYTWIKLYNTPLVAPPVGGGGLATAARLYGLEYIPSPVVAGTAFSRHLATSTNPSEPKNTARWRIRVPASVFDNAIIANVDQRLDVTTRIGNDVTTGTAWPTANQPHNLSVTHSWWASSPTAVPATERFQLLGDPRHCPYADLSNGGNSFPDGYNWHFIGSLGTTTWSFADPTRLQDGYGAGVLEDAPRMLQVLRTALQEAGAVWVQPTGASAQTLLLGGEIALWGATSSGPVLPAELHGDLFQTGGTTSVDSVSSVASSLGVVAGRHVILGNGPGSFWAKPWLGELWPDDAYSSFTTDGNLPTGGAWGTFYRARLATAALSGLPSGTDFSGAGGAQMGSVGGVAMFDAGTSTATFVHDSTTALSATPTTQISEFAALFGEQLASNATCQDPFDDQGALPGVVPYFAFVGSYPKSTLSMLEVFYDIANPKLSGYGVLSMEGPSVGTGPAAFAAVSGLTASEETEHELLARLALMSGLHTLHVAGEPGTTGRIEQVPMLTVLEPMANEVKVDPAAIQLRWSTPFVRFDGGGYTPQYPLEFAEAESDLVYSILYSRDAGTTWYYALTGDPATPGQKPESSTLLVDDAATGAESLIVPTPEAQFIGSPYSIRVECYHRTRGTHLSYQDVSILLRRSSSP